MDAEHIITMLDGPLPKLTPIPTISDMRLGLQIASHSINNEHIKPLPPTDKVRCGVRAFVVEQEFKR